MDQEFPASAELRDEIRHLRVVVDGLRLQLQAERRQAALREKAYGKALATLEERLLRVENSVAFRAVRQITGFAMARTRRLGQAVRTFAQRPLRASEADGDYSHWIELQEAALASFDSHRAEGRAWPKQPCFSLLLPISDDSPDIARIEGVIGSLIGQSYENWQLCICYSQADQLRVHHQMQSVASRDSRIVCTQSTGRPTDLLNAAARLAIGEYIALLSPDDILHQHCLHYVAETLQESGIGVVYTDEDHLDESGKRCEPCLKPGWSPELLTSRSYLGRMMVMNRALLDEASASSGEWFRPSCEAAHEYDLALRLTEGPVTVRHVPRVLYHRAMSASRRNGAPTEQEQGALRDALVRRKVRGSVEIDSVERCFHIRREIADPPLVSIVVCSRNWARFESFVRSLAAGTEYDRVELVLVEHLTGGPHFSEENLARLRFSKIVRVFHSGVFNFSAMNNKGVAAASGSVLLFLNDDVQPQQSDWLARMVSQIQRPEVGVVGARLNFPSGAIQHAGIALGILDGAGHPGRYSLDPDLFPWLNMTRNVAAVTGACLGMRRDVFQELDGFDSRFAVDYNDVDLCLRASVRGYKIILEAGAKLVHHESASRTPVNQSYERTLFYLQWLPQLLPYPDLSPALDETTEAIRLSSPRLFSA